MEDQASTGHRAGGRRSGVAMLGVLKASGAFTTIRWIGKLRTYGSLGELLWHQVYPSSAPPSQRLGSGAGHWADGEALRAATHSLQTMGAVALRLAGGGGGGGGGALRAGKERSSTRQRRCRVHPKDALVAAEFRQKDVGCEIWGL